jgi:hypothetical protein
MLAYRVVWILVLNVHVIDTEVVPDKNVVPPDRSLWRVVGSPGTLLHIPAFGVHGSKLQGTHLRPNRW